MIPNFLFLVAPAKAGVQEPRAPIWLPWMPAFRGHDGKKVGTKRQIGTTGCRLGALTGGEIAQTLYLVYPLARAMGKPHKAHYHEFCEVLRKSSS
jgi:hypothetical protein